MKATLQNRRARPLLPSSTQMSSSVKAIHPSRECASAGAQGRGERRLGVLAEVAERDGAHEGVFAAVEYWCES